MDTVQATMALHCSEIYEVSLQMTAEMESLFANG